MTIPSKIVTTSSYTVLQLNRNLLLSTPCYIVVNNQLVCVTSDLGQLRAGQAISYHIVSGRISAHEG